MANQTFDTITLSAAGATYQFFTKGYQPPAQERYIDKDIVKNQNGKFKYVYDNGPGFRTWTPFVIICEDQFAIRLGVANGAALLTQLQAIWAHVGSFGMKTPDGVYPTCYWADSDLENQFKIFPKSTGQSREYDVTVQIEEGS